MSRLLLAVLLSVLLISCAGASPTPYPTLTPHPTYTPYPTPTLLPTETPTPQPTATPRPTSTPIPMATYIISPYFDGLPIYPNANFLRYNPPEGDSLGTEQYQILGDSPGEIQLFYLIAMEDLGWELFKKEAEEDGTIFLVWMKDSSMALISITLSDIGIIITMGTSTS